MNDIRRRRNRMLVPALLAAVLSVTGLGVASAAGADGITVTSVGTTATGQLIVQLPDPGALSVQATVVSAADGSALATTDHLSWDGGAWVTDDPVRLPAGSAYVDYPVTVDFRLEDGALQHWTSTGNASAGSFSYRRRASVAQVAVDRTSTDLDHRQLTLSGAVVVYDPATGSTGPAGPGVPVRAQWQATTGGYYPTTLVANAVTDPTGTFSITLNSPGGLTVGSVTVASDDPSTVGAAGTALPDVPAVQTDTRMLATPRHARVHAGSTVTVSGTVQRLTPSGWEPWSGAPVVTALQPPSDADGSVSGLLASGSTTAAGAFSYRFRATRTTDIYTAVRPSPYLTPAAYLTEHLDVPTAGTFTALHFTLDQFGEVAARGTLHGRCSSQRVTLQFSPDGRTGWRSLASVTADYTNTTACPFTVSTDGYVSGYYRFTHAENDQMLAATSARSARLHRTPTRITSFSLSPRRPYINSTLRATGYLSQRPGTRWTALGRTPVLLVFEPKGDTQYYLISTSRTDSRGHFSFTGKVYGDGTWVVVYEADSSRFDSSSTPKVVDAR